ncbi:MAG: divalent metal cation transporter [Saprospiraceae bacterium]
MVGHCGGLYRVGTVTTAASAGSRYGMGLLWALLFSVLATMVLQEAAARLRLG